MRIAYITRHFNKSGYEIFRTLIENYIVIDSIILHNKLGAWNTTLLRPFLKLGYHLGCFYYRCKKVNN